MTLRRWAKNSPSWKHGGVIVSRLPCLALCLAVGFITASAQTNVSHDHNAELISRVKNASASQIESHLPSTTFEKWVLRQVGNDATISWTVRIPDDPLNGPPLVEADVSIQGRPGIVIMIVATPRKIRGTKFRLESLLLMGTDDYGERPNLRDLPKAVERARAGM